MALENILKTIEEQTSAEILKVKQDTENQTREILSKAQEEAEIIQAGVLEKFREEKIQEAKTVLREKHNESYQAVLEKKKKILDEVFEEALKKLQESDSSKFRQDFPENGRIVENKRGGFKFVSETIEIDNSFPSLIAEARQKLETKIVNLLF